MPTRRPATEEELGVLRALLSLQFGDDVAKALTSLPLLVERRRGKIRYVYTADGERLMTLRPTDFMFTISLRAGEIIRTSTRPPFMRVVVRGYEDGDVRGEMVLLADARIRPGDEVLVVNENDELLAVGKARAPGSLMAKLKGQDVVRVREVRRVGQGRNSSEGA
ncbi:MAG: prefoldin subunit alpha [Acidilobus sp.]|nr:prefoldin subunit alpha [Acidilobus sp.]